MSAIGSAICPFDAGPTSLQGVETKGGLTSVFSSAFRRGIKIPRSYLPPASK
jgi:hypothetical protein